MGNEGDIGPGSHGANSRKVDERGWVVISCLCRLLMASSVKSRRNRGDLCTYTGQTALAPAPPKASMRARCQSRSSRAPGHSGALKEAVRARAQSPTVPPHRRLPGASWQRDSRTRQRAMRPLVSRQCRACETSGPFAMSRGDAMDQCLCLLTYPCPIRPRQPLPLFVYSVFRCLR